jgi:hypothetical protein
MELIKLPQFVNMHGRQSVHRTSDHPSRTTGEWLAVTLDRTHPAFLHVHETLAKRSSILSQTSNLFTTLKFSCLPKGVRLDRNHELGMHTDAICTYADERYDIKDGRTMTKLFHSMSLVNVTVVRRHNILQQYRSQPFTVLGHYMSFLAIKTPQSFDGKSFPLKLWSIFIAEKVTSVQARMKNVEIISLRSYRKIVYSPCSFL